MSSFPAGVNPTGYSNVATNPGSGYTGGFANNAANTGNATTPINSSVNTAIDASINAAPAFDPADPNLRPWIYCNTGACRYKSKNEGDFEKHFTNQHLGKICHWSFQDTTMCGYTAETQEELLAHFNRDHLALHSFRLDEDGKFCCPWPGYPNYPRNGLPYIPPEGPCQSSFTNSYDVKRHARRHQHYIWQAVKEITGE